MQLPGSTDIIDNLLENFDQKPNQPKDENNTDDNDSNSTTETVAVDGNDENNDRSNDCIDGDLVLDVSGKSMEFSILGDLKESVDGLYLYKNVFNLIPKSVGALSCYLRKDQYGMKLISESWEIYVVTITFFTQMWSVKARVTENNNSISGLTQLQISIIPSSGIPNVSSKCHTTNPPLDFCFQVD
ncbi:hypothetical protein PVK06_016633 [Gossypium arboreum]|uniref:Uncharacterized protein n=1 Tax=Gossypium arboreum TaxID=29729 RepID=A0ABR0Q0I4_GOSAR|nr:hypothetical protein PVK06_016633 [Gossypium arboreum]